MSDPIGLTAVALVVSFTALAIAVVQLLQAVSGTADGYRKTSKEVMGIFATSRDRIFHLAELRFETTFTTPHFTFHKPISESSFFSRIEDDYRNENKVAGRHVLAIADKESRVSGLQKLIKSSREISTLQRFFNKVDPSHSASDRQSLLPQSGAFCATWLMLLERLYEDEQKYTQTTEDCEPSYARTPGKHGLFGPDHRQILYPAIENHVRSWDLLPSEAVRPFASISYGDLLTLCYRLRITVRDLYSGTFSADGHGNNFSSLNIQGLGMIVQYRYDATVEEGENSCPVNTKFVPSENADKLAFSIVPRNDVLGIHRDWRLEKWDSWQSFPDTMKQLYTRLGILPQYLSRIKAQKENNKCDSWRTFYDCVLLLCPFLPIDGLGVVKYQPPMPREYFGSSLAVREARIILRQRLNEHVGASNKLTTSHTSLPTRFTSPFPSQLHWVCAVFNFFEEKYQNQFHKYWDVWHSLVGQNARNTQGHDFVREVVTAAKDIDNYLASLFNQTHCVPTYSHLVAAHQEMSIQTHEKVYKEIRDNPTQDKRSAPGFRTASTPPPTIAEHHKTLQLGLMEVIHRYVDQVMDGATLIDSYRWKTDELEDSQGRRAASLTNDQIRAGWYAMMLRACLWSMMHVSLSSPQSFPHSGFYTTQTTHWKTDKWTHVGPEATSSV
jgi:hypothetical protein